MQRFTIPREIRFGPGSLAYLKELKGRKATVVIGGGSVKRNGALARAEAFLREAGMETSLIENVEPDPSVETVLKGAKAMEAFGPDWIVSIGGGSPIDAAKAMWIFYERPDLGFDDVKEPFSVPELRGKARFLAVPTTSGTATEVTAFAVITDYSTGIKYPLADYNLTPDVAIVDPELALGMPARLAAHTGMDALTHSLEAYVATLRSPFTDALAMKAIEIIASDLESSCRGEPAAREQVHYAQCMAGMAFTNALLGIVHSMAHKTGAVFSIPHGCANAIYLPAVLQYNGGDPATLARYADVARRLGVAGAGDKELCAGLVEAVRGLNRKVGIPPTLRDFGVPEALFEEKVRLVSERALTDPCTGSNPREIDADRMERLFRCIYEGRDCDF